MAAHVDRAVSFEGLKYQPGFGNHFATEALPGALPLGQNNPQKCEYGLYAEQLSGTAFTCPRGKNFRTWMYKVRPSVAHGGFRQISNENTSLDLLQPNPNQLRWRPFEIPTTPGVTFVSGLKLVAGAGCPTMKEGLGIYVYAMNASMDRQVMYNSDGDFLIVPQQGTLKVQTEMGLLVVEPQEILVVPRGIKFNIAVDGPSRGYVLEIYKGHFELPSLGPIGANGLANPRDFQAPVAHFQDVEGEFTMVNKFSGLFYEATLTASPFDTVAWHGNYYPYKYDLRLFCTMNSVSFDHPDPSIYTVLTVPTDEHGVAVADFVIFPPRWMVMERSFRPPYYHRNCMGEFMGMIYGKYDAKEGFMPGGASMHSCMSAHGPDGPTFLAASNADLKPQYFDGGLAFMFESTYMMKIASTAANASNLERDYTACWQQLPKVYPDGQAV